MKRYSTTMASGRPALIQSDDGRIVLHSESAARIESLELELADSWESNTAAYMLGVEDGKADYAKLADPRIEALEWLVDCEQFRDLALRMYDRDDITSDGWKEWRNMYAAARAAVEEGRDGR